MPKIKNLDKYRDYILKKVSPDIKIFFIGKISCVKQVPYKKDEKPARRCIIIGKYGIWVLKTTLFGVTLEEFGSFIEVQEYGYHPDDNKIVKLKFSQWYLQFLEEGNSTIKILRCIQNMTNPIHGFPEIRKPIVSQETRDILDEYEEYFPKLSPYQQHADLYNGLCEIISNSFPDKNVINHLDEILGKYNATDTPEKVIARIQVWIAEDSYQWLSEEEEKNNVLHFNLNECLKEKTTKSEAKVLFYMLRYSRWFLELSCSEFPLDKLNIPKLLEAIGEAQNLRYVRLSDVKLKGKHFEDFEGFGESIKFLDLSWNNLGDIGMKYIGEDSDFRPISIALTHCNIKNGLQYLEKQFRDWESTLYDLNLSLNNLDKKSLHVLTNLIKRAACLRSLILANCCLDLDAASAALSSNSNLLNTIKVLDFSVGIFSDSAASKLGNFITNSSSLDSIILSRIEISEAGLVTLIKDLCNRSRFTTLLDLFDISETAIGIHTAQAIAKEIRLIGKLPVKKFIANNCRIGTEGMGDISAAIAHTKDKKLEVISMQKNVEITGSEPEDHLKALQAGLYQLVLPKNNLLSLIELDLSGGDNCYLSEQIVPFVINLGFNNTIKILDISGNKAGKGFGKAFGEMLTQNKCVEVAFIDNNDITLSEFDDIVKGLANNNTIIEMPVPECDLKEIEQFDSFDIEVSAKLENLRTTYNSLINLNANGMRKNIAKEKYQQDVVSNNSIKVQDISLAGNRRNRKRHTPHVSISPSRLRKMYDPASPKGFSDNEEDSDNDTSSQNSEISLESPSNKSEHWLTRYQSNVEDITVKNKGEEVYSSGDDGDDGNYNDGEHDYDDDSDSMTSLNGKFLDAISPKSNSNSNEDLRRNNQQAFSSKSGQIPLLADTSPRNSRNSARFGSSDFHESESNNRGSSSANKNNKNSKETNDSSISNNNDNDNNNNRNDTKLLSSSSTHNSIVKSNDNDLNNNIKESVEVIPELEEAPISVNIENFKRRKSTEIEQLSFDPSSANNIPAQLNNNKTEQLLLRKVEILRNAGGLSEEEINDKLQKSLNDMFLTTSTANSSISNSIESLNLADGSDMAELLNKIEILKRSSGVTDSELQWKIESSTGNAYLLAEKRFQDAELEYEKNLFNLSKIEKVIYLLSNPNISRTLSAIVKAKFSTLSEDKTSTAEESKAKEACSPMDPKSNLMAALAKKTTPRPPPPQGVGETEIAKSLPDPPKAKNSPPVPPISKALPFGGGRPPPAFLGGLSGLGGLGGGLPKPKAPVTVDTHRKKIIKLMASEEKEINKLTVKDEQFRVAVDILEKVVSSEDDKFQQKAAWALDELQNLKTSTQKELNIIKGSVDTLMNNIDLWRNRMADAPEIKMVQRVREMEWENANKAKNILALKIMRSYIPVNIQNMTTYDLMKAGTENAGFFTYELANYLKSKKILWWVVQHKDDIAKSNFLMGADVSAFKNLQDYDIFELRAIYAALPDIFDRDGDGKKAEWRKEFVEKLKALVQQDNGETIYSGWDPVRKERRKVKLPQLVDEKRRNSIYFYPTKKMIHEASQKFIIIEERLANKKKRLDLLNGVDGVTGLVEHAKVERDAAAADSRSSELVSLYGKELLVQLRNESSTAYKKLLDERGSEVKEGPSNIRRTGLYKEIFDLEERIKNSSPTKKEAEALFKVLLRDKLTEYDILDALEFISTINNNNNNNDSGQGYLNVNQEEEKLREELQERLYFTSSERGKMIYGPFPPNPVIKKKEVKTFKKLTDAEEAALRMKEMTATINKKKSNSVMMNDQSDRNSLNERTRGEGRRRSSGSKVSINPKLASTLEGIHIKHGTPVKKSKSGSIDETIISSNEVVVTDLPEKSQMALKIKPKSKRLSLIHQSTFSDFSSLEKEKKRHEKSTSSKY